MKTIEQQIDKLQKELDKLKELNNNQQSTTTDLFSITSYSQICKALNIKEKTEKDFDTIQEFAFHQIKNIEKLYNGNWRPKFGVNQRNYYPYFYDNTGSGLVFSSSIYDVNDFSGQVAYFKDEKTSTYIGKTFLHIYKNILQK